MGCIKRCFSRNTPLLLLQKRTVDRAIYHLNQSRWNQYLVCDRADDNLYKKNDQPKCYYNGKRSLHRINYIKF